MNRKKNNISLSHIIVQGKGNIVSEMDKEKVMLSIHNGKYYNLGQIGGKIWDFIEMPTPVSQVIVNLMSEYEVDKVICEEQVLSFLELLLEEGLIDIKDVAV